MRILDIINESMLAEASALAPKSFYRQERLIALIKRLSEPNEEFLKIDGTFTKIPATTKEIAGLKRLVRTNYDGKGNSIDDSLMPKVIGKIPLNQLVKTNEFGGKNVSATGEAAGKANIGPTTEALKSMAIFTKLITRDKPSIDVKDVMKVAKRLKAKEELVQSPSGKVTTSSAEIVVNPEEIRPGKDGKTIKDKISIHINVSSPSFDRAIQVSPADKEAWGILQGVLTYVNTESDIGKYGRYFSQNVKRDPIHIAVVGLSGAKTDIKTVYQDGIDRGVDDQGNPIERELSHLSMSIKAGSDMYDQASGSTVEGMTKFFETLGLTSEQAIAAMKSVEYTPKPRMKAGQAEDKAITKQRVDAVRKIYHAAATELQTEIGSMTNREEGSYIHRLLTKLTSSIQGKGRLVYVNFDTKGRYHKLNPAQIIQLAKSVDLGVHLDTSKSEPHIYIKDMISGKAIFHVRPAILKTGRITHTFELDHLLDLVKGGQVTQTPQATANASTANTPAVEPEKADNTQGMAAPKYNLRTNKMTKKEPSQGLAPSLEIPNMANNALDPSSHLAIAESKK
jgi:hypothetical protein